MNAGDANKLTWAGEEGEGIQVGMGRAQPVLEVGSRAKKERECPEKETRAGRDTAHRGLGRNENMTQRGRGPRSQGTTQCWKLVSWDQSCKANIL